MPEGWAAYEARMEHPGWVPWAVRETITHNRKRMLKPGDPLHGRRILVFTEQGMGDAIMFARYLPILAAQGAMVTLACPPVLAPILARVDGIDTLLTPPTNQPDGKLNLSAVTFDAFTPLMSLPYVFSTTETTIPARVPYLQPDPALVKHWQAHYQSHGRKHHLRVGIVFQANPASRNAAPRSLGLGDVRRMAQRRNIDLVNLQHGAPGRALAESVENIIDVTSEPMGLDAYAAAIAATDMLISVDTLAAHCAGAMGHPLRVILPSTIEWRWSRNPDTTPWYPSATLFRQSPGQHWSAVVAAACASP